MTTITSNSKIAIRYTTAPADMGYGGTKTNWRTARADKIASPRKALDYIAGLKRNLGGADFLIDLRCGDKPISMDDLSYAVTVIEAKR